MRAAASRLTQVAWRSHVKDPGFQETAYVTLLARASASLKARPRSVGVGGRVRLSGRIRGAIPTRGVPVIFQGRAGNGPLHDVRRGARPQGPLPIGYRFRSAGSRGRTFCFRVRVRGDARFPYATGYSKRVTVRVR